MEGDEQLAEKSSHQSGQGKRGPKGGANEKVVDVALQPNATTMVMTLYPMHSVGFLRCIIAPQNDNRCDTRHSL
jgi:hypothetical protein